MYQVLFKNLKKLHLEAKLSNLRMALVPFKNLLRFLQKKCSKHLKIDQKDLSQVAKFVSHDGSYSAIKNLKKYDCKLKLQTFECNWSQSKIIYHVATKKLIPSNMDVCREAFLLTHLHAIHNLLL